jgi:hypothetical protein
VLTEGRVLRTLHDARDMFASGRFDGVTNSPPLEYALDLRMLEAETGEPADIDAAIAQIARMLKIRQIA